MSLIIIDNRVLKCILKLIEHDNKICNGLSDCFETKEDQVRFIRYITTKREIPDRYIFEIWDLIGLHGSDILSKEDQEHIEYLYAQGTDNLVENANKLYNEWIE